MEKCRLCGGADFYKEAGYFFCHICQTQKEDIREEILDIRVDLSTRLRKTRIRRPKSGETSKDLGWTSWELYNFVLIGLTDEIIELGAPSDIKLTVLQLWATYLGRIEIAFTSTKKKSVPKLAKRYNERDAEIIYGKLQSKTRSRKRRRIRSSTGTSMTCSYQSEGTSSLRELNKTKKLLINADYDRYMQSQASSEGDGISSFSQSAYSTQSSTDNYSNKEIRLQFSTHAKKEINKIKNISKSLQKDERVQYRQKHITTQYKIGPHIITPMRLWAIIYLALRIHNHSIHLGDMMRYGREGHLSYYKLDHLVPSEIKLTRSDIKFLSQNKEITHKGMRRIIASMARFLGVHDIICSDFLPLVNRYCQELALPRGISLYAERLIALSPPKMAFDIRMPYAPNYEGRAMAFIIVVLKTLFGLDGMTEHQICKVAEKINRIACWNSVTNDKLKYKGCECNSQTDIPCLIIHGSTQNYDDTNIIEKMMACKKAASRGYKKLISGKSSVEAVESALWWLECDEFFNCSYGSVLNKVGNVQMDASMMDGSKLTYGSIAAVSDIEHPISLARYAMEYIPNSMIVGKAARKLAKYANMTLTAKGNMVAPAAHLAFKLHGSKKFEDDCSTEDFYDKAITNVFGAVGCVAYDGSSIAVGSTTGGLNGKLEGSVGYSSIIGSGIYADKNIGCSLTGEQDIITQLGLCHFIVEDIEQETAPKKALQKNLDVILNKFKCVGGGIVLHRNGSWGIYFTSDRMPYAMIKNNVVTFGTELNEERIQMYYDLDQQT